MTNLSELNCTNFMVGNYYVFSGNKISTAKRVFRLNKFGELGGYTFVDIVDGHKWDYEVEAYALSVPFVDVRDIPIKQAYKIISKAYIKELSLTTDIKIDPSTVDKEARIKELLEKPYVEQEYKADFNETKLTKELNMKNLKTQITDKNLTAAKSAAKVVAGNTLNKTVMAKIRPHLPMLMRGYSEHVLAEVVAANLVSFAVDNFAADNEKAQWAAEAMMTSAMTNLMTSFNLDTIIADLLEGITIPEVESE